MGTAPAKKHKKAGLAPTREEEIAQSCCRCQLLLPENECRIFRAESGLAPEFLPTRCKDEKL